MDEEITIIDSNTRNEKIKNFFVNNKKILILLKISSLPPSSSFFTFEKYETKKKIEISNCSKLPIETQKKLKKKLLLF